jgi:hypothetical protein
MVYSLLGNSLLSLKLMVIQNSAFFSDAMPKLSNKMYPLDEATLKCATQNTTYVLEKLKATYSIPSFWYITIL